MSLSQFFKDVMNKVFAYSNYELVNTAITLFQLRRLRYWAFQEVMTSVRNCNGYLLDLGAGDGSMTRFIISNGFRHRPIILLDPAISGLRSMGNLHSELVDRVVGVSEYLPLKRGSICTVYTSFALRQFNNKPLALIEVRRILRKDGSFIVLEFWRPDNPLTYAVLLFYLVFALPLLVSIVAPREVRDYATMRITVRGIGSISWLRELIKELVGNIESYQTYLGIFLLIRAVRT
ncbi:class I SAM-dependent methyltransferase [Vulcanisaeta moutnovskia]|uniref:class I SAM-dependent methyltransferase n=1 Tax=Vulcanisaeta moutnovskia TaxID=985052 RepID=UPI001ED93F5E|nr:class I SAM-dependent methyltransferase [Vulcanisaeta moutnovskia]